MSNEWNKYSDLIHSQKKEIASVRVRRRSPIYKHIVIRRMSVGPNRHAPINTKDEHRFLSSNRITAARWMCLTHRDTREMIAEHRFPIKESAMEVSLVEGRFDLSNFVMNLSIDVGKKLNNQSLKAKTLRIIAERELSISPDTRLEFFSNERDSLFYAICFNNNELLSDCCKANLVVQVSKDCGGKVICPHKKCIIHCLWNFFVEKPDRDLLWLQKSQLPLKPSGKIPKSLLLTHPIAALHPIAHSNPISAPSDSFSIFTDGLQQMQKVLKSLKITNSH